MESRAQWRSPTRHTELSLTFGFTSEFVQFQPQCIDGIPEQVDVSEVLRYLGYPPGQRPQPRVHDLIRHWIEEAARQAEPRAVYVVLPILHKDARRLCVQTAGGPIEFRGAIGQFLAISQLLVVFLATAGPGVEALASALMTARDDLAAMIVNAVGAERAESAEAAVIQRVRQHVDAIGFSTTLPYSPGYCGMALTEQRKVFDVFGGQTAGIELTAACLMRPIKSVSGLVGLAPAMDIEATGSPCDRCDADNCNMRR